MKKTLSTNDAASIMQVLVGKTLQYGYLYPSFGMFDFGFGNIQNVPSDVSCNAKTVYEYALHVLCEFDIVWKNGSKFVKRFCWDSPKASFEHTINHLIGLEIRRVALSDNNDLWLDLGDYWIVFITYDNNKESWRFFSPYSSDPHLVVSTIQCSLDYSL